MFFFVWFFIPETKGISLERMDDLFGITELVDRKKMMDEDIPQREDDVAPKEGSVTRVENVEKEEKI